MKPLRSRFPALAIAGVVAIGPLAGSTAVHADPIDDQRAKVAQYADKLEELEERAMILGEEYDVALMELRELEADVAKAEEAVAAKQAEFAELQEQLSDVAVRAFMGAGTSGLGVFADPAQFNEDLQRSELTRVAMNAGTADADDLEAAARDLAEEQANLESKRDAAEAKKDEVDKAREATEAQTAEYKELRAEAEAELGEMIRKEEERRAREAYERMQAEAAAAEARARAQAEAEQRAQQQASSAQPTSSGGGSNTSSGGGNASSGGSSNSSSSASSSASRGGGASANVPAASSRAQTAVNAALSQQGVPYRFAAAQPGVAFDCSGLTSWAWAQAGVSLPHQSARQAAMLPSVPHSQAQPGDLIFYYSPVSHVGIYIGGGQLVHAPNTGSEVHVRSVSWGKVVKVGRPG